MGGVCVCSAAASGGSSAVTRPAAILPPLLRVGHEGSHCHHGVCVQKGKGFHVSASVVSCKNSQCFPKSHVWTAWPLKLCLKQTFCVECFCFCLCIFHTSKLASSPFVRQWWCRMKLENSQQLGKRLTWCQRTPSASTMWPTSSTCCGPALCRSPWALCSCGWSWGRLCWPDWQSWC